MGSTPTFGTAPAPEILRGRFAFIGKTPIIASGYLVGSEFAVTLFSFSRQYQQEHREEMLLAAPYHDEDDATLARQAVTDPDAFDVLYRRYVASVYRFCYARVNQTVEAEDLTSQTFEAALAGLRRYRGRGTFAAWLFGIARRKCADHHRARHAHPHVDVMALEAQADPEAGDPEEIAFLGHVVECVRRSLPALTPDRAEALQLRYWAGLDFDEIAIVMRRGRDAVKMLISRGLHDLRERCVQ